MALSLGDELKESNSIIIWQRYYTFGCTALTYKKLIVHFRGAIRCEEIILVQPQDNSLSNKVKVLLSAYLQYFGRYHACKIT